MVAKFAVGIDITKNDKIERKVDPDSIVLRISESRRSTAHAETEVEQSE